MPTPHAPDGEISGHGLVTDEHVESGDGPDTAPGTDVRGPGPDELDDGLAELDGLSGRAVQEHVAVYERLHVGLQATLAEIDSA